MSVIVTMVVIGSVGYIIYNEVQRYRAKRNPAQSNDTKTILGMYFNDLGDLEVRVNKLEATRSAKTRGPYKKKAKTRVPTKRIVKKKV